METLNGRIITLLCASLLSGALQADAERAGNNDLRVEACAKAAFKAATGKSDAGAFTLTNLAEAPQNDTGFPGRYLRTQINLTVAGQRFACEVNSRGQVRRLTRMPLEESSLYAGE